MNNPGQESVGRWAIRLIVRLLQAEVVAIQVNFILSITRTVLLLFVVIAVLNRLGVNTTSLIALPGAAGQAHGQALQKSLRNFAAGVLLIIFRPFKNGDYGEAGGTADVVKSIGVFTTTLRTGDNREVIVPNGGIYNDTITNYSARDTRRIDMVFGIGYDDDIREAKGILHCLLAKDDRILKDPEPLVAVGELGDNSVNFNVRLWVKSGNYRPVRYDLMERVKRPSTGRASPPYPQMGVHLDNAATWRPSSLSPDPQAPVR